MQILLAGSPSLMLEKIVHEGDAITAFARCRRNAAACPQCQTINTKVHSRYERTIADLPWAGVNVRIRLRARKFFCPNSECVQRIFCERLPDLVSPYGHRSGRLNETLAVIGFALGGRGGSRLAQRLGMCTGRDSILRRIRLAASQPAGDLKVRVLGVDDWALKKGQNYGTILVDMEKHRPIDLLIGRESAPFEEWLKAHPEIEIITRDRAGAYADGARKGAPQAQQVVDRWHLLKNGNEAFERLIQRQRKAIREAIAKIPADEKQIPEPEAIKISVVPETASEYKRSRAAREQRQAFHAERMTRYDQVQDLKRQGFSIIQIRNHLGWSYVEVANFYRADEYPVIRRKKGRSCLDKFDEYLRQRWAAGCQNAGQLYRELSEKGYKGSALTVRRHVQLWRQQGPELAPASQKLSAPSPKSCVWLLLKNDERLTDEERKLRPVILDASPLIKEGLELVRSFRDAICSGDERTLDSWIEKASKCGLPDFENFVKALRRDEAAVRAAVSSEWSNGQTEGQVNRLKVIKRQMYGRAKFDLLRSRVLNAA